MICKGGTSAPEKVLPPVRHIGNDPQRRITYWIIGRQPMKPNGHLRYTEYVERSSGLAIVQSPKKQKSNVHL